MPIWFTAILQPRNILGNINMIEKLYPLSKHPDKEVERAIHEMDENKLRVALYGIARGWGFDVSMDIAVFIGRHVQESWTDTSE